MKRGCEIDATRHKRAAMVRLNVGGMRFDTTRDTLAHCEYFVAYLSGRMSHAEDSAGRLFIDRSGELFAHVLEFMRSKTLPGRRLLDGIKHQLLHECGYYGMAHMADRINGEISPYDLRYADRAIKDDEKLFNVFKVDMSPQDPISLQIPLLPRFGGEQQPHPRPSATYYEFRRRFEKLSGGLLRHLTVDSGGLVFAGGAVLGALTGTPIGDIDVFLCCGQAEALRISERVYAAVQSWHKSCNGGDLLVTRSKHALTIFRVAPTIYMISSARTEFYITLIYQVPGHPAVPLQVVLTTYGSPLELLKDFDVDCCCVAFIPSDEKVVATSRGVRAVSFFSFSLFSIQISFLLYNVFRLITI